MEDEQYLYQLGIQGKLSKEFISSVVGRYVIEQAQKEEREALQGLAGVDPNDSDTIRELQNKVMISSKCLIWLDEAIQAGKQATQLLEGREE